jgi:transcription elongation GreA/GreB family factor
MKILTNSPLASALMGKKDGDRVEYEAPIGTQRYEVVSFEDS